MPAVDNTKTYLDVLNPAQRAAACFAGSGADGTGSTPPLLIIAGAGTGKTMTLAHRVAHLIVAGVPSERLMLLTFTRRAATEMTRRTEAIVHKAMANGSRGSQPMPVTLPWSGTFHSIANRLLRRYAVNLALDPGFSVLDRADAADLLDVVRHELQLSKVARRFPKKDTCLAIYSRVVNARQPLDKLLESTYPWCLDWETELRTLFRAYVERKQQMHCLDYDDLLLYLGLLLGDEDIARDIGGWFEHVLVDEYQDTNLLQDEILRALKPDGYGVTVVGDDAQSIYSFRGAEVENILGFPTSFAAPARIVTLEQNYRSSQAILDTANCLVNGSERQYHKVLRAERPAGGKPDYVTVEDGEAEADFVAECVLQNRESGMSLKNQAVLFRSAHHSDRLELELVRRNIPYVKYGGLKFLEAAHVKDLLATLKWAENARNAVAAFRVLKLLPGMGPSLAGRCMQQLAVADYSFGSLQDFRPPPASATEWPAFCQLMQVLAAAPREDQAWQSQLTQARHWYRPQLERLYDGFETREADLEQLEQIASRYPTRERFLTELTLDPPAVAGDLAGDPLRDEDYLVLSTVHSAKGQEWDAVYILNVTDGNFPSEFATGRPDAIDEERRLLYVAMTRARQSLSLIAPLKFFVTQQQRDGDRHVYGARSRFMTQALLATMRPVFHGRKEAKQALPGSDKHVDAAARVREMW